MAIAAALMSGFRIGQHTVHVENHARIVRSSATRRRVSKKNRLPQLLSRGVLTGAFRFGRDGMLPSLNMRAADTAASRFFKSV